MPSENQNPGFMALAYNVYIDGGGYKLLAGCTSGIEVAIAMALGAINSREQFIGHDQVKKEQLSISIAA